MNVHYMKVNVFCLNVPPKWVSICSDSYKTCLLFAITVHYVLVRLVECQLFFLATLLLVMKDSYLYDSVQPRFTYLCTSQWPWPSDAVNHWCKTAPLPPPPLPPSFKYPIRTPLLGTYFKRDQHAWNSTTYACTQSVLPVIVTPV